MEYKTISLSDWDAKGNGATAEDYFSKTDPSIMLKLFYNDISSDIVVREFKFSNEVKKTGVTTPAAIEIVQTENPKKMGILYERIQDKVSFSRLFSDDFKDCEKYAKIFANEAKALHAKTCNPETLPSMKKKVRKALERSGLLNRYKKVLLEKLEQVDDKPYCVHGDFYYGNLVFSKKTGLNYWIDLSDFSYGSPLFDLGKLYYLTWLDDNEIQVKKNFHLDYSQLQKIWGLFIREYLETEDKAKITAFENELKIFALFHVVCIFDNFIYAPKAGEHYSKWLLNIRLNLMAFKLL